MSASTAGKFLKDTFDSASGEKSIFEHLQAVAKGEDIPSTALGLAGLGADAISTFQAAATPIIAGGLRSIAAMSWMCGAPGTSPGDGTRFTNGADKFGSMLSPLDEASPTDSWQGVGSDAYAQQNEKQEKRAKAMTNLDNQVASIVSTQAVQVSETKTVLDVSATVLSYMIPVALAANTIPVPPAGQAAQRAVEIGAVLGSVPRCVFSMTALANRASENAQQLEEKANEYTEIADDAKPLGEKKAKPKKPTGGTDNPNIPGGGFFPHGSDDETYDGPPIIGLPQSGNYDDGYIEDRRPTGDYMTAEMYEDVGDHAPVVINGGSGGSDSSGQGMPPIGIVPEQPSSTTSKRRASGPAYYDTSGNTAPKPPQWPNDMPQDWPNWPGNQDDGTVIFHEGAGSENTGERPPIYYDTAAAPETARKNETGQS